MLSATQLSHLITPVQQRADASRHCLASGFIDRAASLLIKRFESYTSNAEKRDWRSNELQLHCCQGIDQQVLDFFNRFPLGTGIEVDGGLSTRFHRISEKLDWPRFHWRTINPLDVDDCIQYAFPQMDNHLSLACNSADDWHKLVPWSDGSAKIIILGEQQPFQQLDSLLTHLHQLEEKIHATNTPLRLIICHRLDDFIPFASVHQIAHQRIGPSLSSNFFHRVWRHFRKPEQWPLTVTRVDF